MIPRNNSIKPISDRTGWSPTAAAVCQLPASCNATCVLALGVWPPESTLTSTQTQMLPSVHLNWNNPLAHQRFCLTNTTLKKKYIKKLIFMKDFSVLLLNRLHLNLGVSTTSSNVNSNLDIIQTVCWRLGL